MFVGESSHSLDDKNRLFIAKRFQDQLQRSPDGHLTAVLTRGFERCLFLFSQEGFQAVLARLRTQPFGGAQLRKMQRLFFANAHATQLDASGRLLIPEKLKVAAGLEKEVVVIGVADRAEIWSKPAWEAFERDNGDDYDDLDVVLCGDGTPPEG